MRSIVLAFSSIALALSSCFSNVLSFKDKQSTVSLDTLSAVFHPVILSITRDSNNKYQVFKIVDKQFGTAIRGSDYNFDEVVVGIAPNDNFDEISLHVSIKTTAVAGRTILLLLQNSTDSILAEHIIFITAPPKQKDLNVAKLTLGTNLDDVDGFHLESFYSSLTFFDPCSQFEAGVYRSRYLTSVDTLKPYRTVFLNEPIINDNIRLVRQLITGKLQTTTSVLGLFFSLRLLDAQRSGKLTWSYNAYFEVIESYLSYNSDSITSAINLDTAVYKLSDIGTKVNVDTLTSARNRIMYDSYFGPGISLRYDDKSLDLRLRAAIGDNSFKPTGFYLIRFDITLKTVSGLRIGGEVRGRFKIPYLKNPSPPNINPTVSVYLGKEIPLSQLYALFTTGS